MSSVLLKSFFAVSGLAFVLSGCTTTTSTKPATASALTTPAASNPAPKFPSFSSPARSVAPDLAQACINSAANKYFLPTRVIKAVDSRKPGDGSTQVILKVDLRDAVCTVSAGGVVKSVIDTSPKSADQIAAEAQAAAAPKTTSQTATANTVARATRKSPSTTKTSSGVKKRSQVTASSGQSLY